MVKQRVTIGIRGGIVAIWLAAVLQGPAAAQERSDNEAVDALLACRSERDDTRRLSCFDRTIRGIEAARAGDGLVVLTPDQRRQRRQAGFGLRVEPAPVEKAHNIAEVETLDGVVARATPVGRDRFVVTLADRSVWRTTEPARIEPAAGNPVHIRRGAMGSYLGSFNKARSIRIERLR